ncbi:MAG: hypothetical protein KKF68_01450 [Nanoarchaeota archaeon]|nr:hypothetical protein [Nanoarchaeota archaeon]
MKINKVKTNFGNIRFFETSEASFNVETILPKKKLPVCYLKKSKGYLIILEGKGKSSKGGLKKGDFIKIKPKEKFWIENNSNKKLKYLARDILPIDEDGIVWEDK